MLEDLQDDVGLIERTLRKEGMAFSGRRVDSRDEFTESLDKFQPDVILSDHALPQFNSLEALQICRKHAANVPFILVTGTVSEEFAVSCLKEGADDYVLKSNMVRLPAAIYNALRQRQLEAKRKKAEHTLRQQNDELIKINKELDSFVYSVSHNLRAPLMSVLGLINLVQLENRKNDDVLDSYLMMMRQSIHKLDETLKEILEYSRNARTQLRISQVDIEKTIEESLDRMKFIDGSDTLRKSIRIPSNAPFYTDAYRLSVIMNNVVSNAIKYRDGTKSESWFDIEANVTDGQLHLVFSDNGIGIGQAHLPRIFEMFFRATEKSDGAGLGLYIVRETVDKLGGDIAIESTAATGTVISIMLPNLKRLEGDAGAVGVA
jgi:signal transduction histidine kinase